MNRIDADGHGEDNARPTDDTSPDTTNRDGAPEPLLTTNSAGEKAEQSAKKAENPSQTQAQGPANSRTDVVLYSNEYTPKPTKETAWFWETKWKAGTCSGDKCSQSSANEKQTISLVESVNGGAFKPAGDPAKGTAHDQISPEPKTFNQRWFVDGKQVQLVVGKDSKGSVVKTWEVHVEIKHLATFRRKSEG